MRVSRSSAREYEAFWGQARWRWGHRGALHLHWSLDGQHLELIRGWWEGEHCMRTSVTRLFQCSGMFCMANPEFGPLRADNTLTSIGEYLGLMVCNLSPNTIKHQLLSRHKEQPSTKQPCHSPSANILHSSQWKLATLHEQWAEKAISSHRVILGKQRLLQTQLASGWIQCVTNLSWRLTPYWADAVCLVFYRGWNLFGPSVHPKPLCCPHNIHWATDESTGTMICGWTHKFPTCRGILRFMYYISGCNNKGNIMGTLL